jgi:hypothetical protein
MGRHSASYIAEQQAPSTGTTAGGAARYVGRVGGLALALGLGAAVAGGAGLAHADGAADAKPGPTADGGTPDDVDSSTKTTKPKLGLFNAPKVTLGSGGTATGHLPDPDSLPGMISKLPQRIAGLVADRTPVAGGASTPTPTTGGRATPEGGSRGSTRHRADFSQAGPTTVSKVPQFSGAVEDVATKLHTGAQSLGLAPSTPSAPDPTPPQRLNVSSYTATNSAAVTTFAGPAQSSTALVATTVSNLLGSLGGVSGSGGSPVAPGQVILGALQLVRRELDRPSLVQELSLTSIGTLFHPAPAPVVPAPPTDTAPATAPYLPTDTVATPYGNIGKWMLESNGQISDYGGQPHDGKTLLEPVNVIIVDPNSKSAAESAAKINRDMFLAGFPAQPIHSSGFLGLIGSKTYGQQAPPLTAYSDNLFILQNDHGRLFGPAPATGGGYVWTGAFSTETPTIYNGLPTHAYVSSNAARDALVLRLLATGQVQSISYIPLDNAVDTDTTTTGDHDGYAVVIVLK